MIWWEVFAALLGIGYILFLLPVEIANGAGR